MFRNSHSFLNQSIVKLFSSKLSPSACHRSSRCLSSQQVRCYSDKRSRDALNSESHSSDPLDQYDEPILASKAQQTYRADLSSTQLLTNHQPFKHRKSKEDPDEANLFEDFREPTEESVIKRRPTNNQESHGIFNPAFSVVPRPSFKRRLNKEDFKRYHDAEKHALENLNLEKYEELYRENMQYEEKKRKATSPDSQLTEHIDDRSLFEQYLENREFQEHTVEMFEELVKSDEDRERIKTILSEYELEKYNTSQVPTRISVEIMTDLLRSKTEHDLVRLFKLYFRREVKKVVQKARHELEKKLTRERLEKKFEKSVKRSGLEFGQNGAPVYAKWKTTMFISFNRESLRKANDRLVRDASMFGPRLAIDFGFNQELLKTFAYHTLKTQLYFTINEIRNARIPFHLNLCNLERGSKLDEFFRTDMPYLFQPSSLINVTSQSYLDIFPKSNLVYLTPDSNRTLTRVDPEKVYIIGGFCDQFRHSQSHNKARSEGLPTFKLPLEQYFFFKQERTLTMNAVTGILCKYLEKPDWRYALVGKVPTRKLKTPDEIRFEQYRKVKKYFSKEKFFKVQQFSQEPHAAGVKKSNELDGLYEKIFPTRSTNMPVYNESYRKRGALRDYLIDDQPDETDEIEY